jgi:hypothetical protein
MTDHQTSAVLTLTRRLRARFKETDFTIHQGGRYRDDETHVDIQWGEGPPVDVVTTICSEELADDTVQLSFMRWQTCPACGYITARPEDGVFIAAFVRGLRASNFRRVVRTAGNDDRGELIMEERIGSTVAEFMATEGNDIPIP